MVANDKVLGAWHRTMAPRVEKALEAKNHPDIITREELFCYLHPERFTKYNRSPDTPQDRNIRWKITVCMKRMPGYRYDGGTDNPRFRKVNGGKV